MVLSKFAIFVQYLSIGQTKRCLAHALHVYTLTSRITQNTQLCRSDNYDRLVQWLLINSIYTIFIFLSVQLRINLLYPLLLSILRNMCSILPHTPPYPVLLDRAPCMHMHTCVIRCKNYIYLGEYLRSLLDFAHSSMSMSIISPWSTLAMRCSIS